MKTKIIKLVSLLLVCILLFALPTSGASAEINWRGNDDYIQAQNLSEDGNLKGYNRDARVSLEMKLVFTGNIRSAIMWDLQDVYDGKRDISEVLRFGDGTWYYDLNLEYLNTTTDPNRKYWYALDNPDEKPIQYSALYVTECIVSLQYNQSGGFPNLIRYGGNDMDYYYDLVTNENLDFTVYCPTTGFTGVCYASILGVTVHSSPNQSVYRTGGDNTPLDIYFVNTFNMMSTGAQYRFTTDDHSIPRIDYYENIVMNFDVSREDVPKWGFPEYRVNGPQNSLVVAPYYVKMSFDSPYSDFSIKAIDFAPENNTINGMDLRYTFGVNEPNIVTKNYKPYVNVFTSYRFTSSVVLENTGAVMGEYDISGLYAKIEFSVPSWNDEVSVGENIKDIFLGLLTAVFTLLGNCLYNAAVWIFCESPVLSDLTKPLFMLMIETGGIFTDFFIPLLGALGFFTPIAFALLLVGIIRKFAR